MSMAHSLEVRAPFLDYRVIEYAASLPSSMKIKGGGKKYILKKALKPLLPETILHRRKHGFTVPLDKWFRGELRSISERNLFRNASMGEYFSIPYMRRVWDEHQSKKRNHGTLLWSLLSFSLWHRTYMESSLPFPQAPEHPN
jgi:asparagine synthase (glutamine-hydrolysing)